MATFLGSLVTCQQTWSRRRSERNRLMSWVQQDPRTLQDMGIAIHDALREARKPFWKA